MSIGQRLKEARKIRGLSQDMLAAKIGASRGVITNIEYDKAEEPQPMVINALCSTLNIDKDWLPTGTGTMDVNPAAARSAKILSEIYELAKELTEEDQLFILDVMKSYSKHLKSSLQVNAGNLKEAVYDNILTADPRKCSS